MSNDPISSIAVIPSPSENFDEVWMIVERANGKFVERMAPRQIISQSGDDVVALIQHQIRVDSAVTYNSSATIRTGLSHLEGETVYVLGDGTFLDSEVVVSGSITASAVHTYGIVGLPYFSDLETLDITYSSAENGTPVGVKLKVGNLLYRFVDSGIGGYIGPDEDNLYQAITNQRISHASSELLFTPEGYDWTAQPVTDPASFSFTGDLMLNLGAGWAKGGRSFFQQRSPLAVTVTSIVPSVNEGGPV